MFHPIYSLLNCTNPLRMPQRHKNNWVPVRIDAGQKAKKEDNEILQMMMWWLYSSEALY